MSLRATYTSGGKCGTSTPDRSPAIWNERIDRPPVDRAGNPKRGGNVNSLIRRRLAGWSALLLLASLVPLLALPAAADHIPSTGEIPLNCQEWQAGVTGAKSVGDVTINVTAWNSDGKGFSFSVAGLLAGQFVDISVKYGNSVEEAGPYGNGVHAYSNTFQNAISHVRICVFATPPGEPEDVAVSVSGSCVVVEGSEVGRFTVTIASVSGNDVTVALLGATLTNGQSVDGALGVSHGWTAASASGNFTPVPNSGNTSAARGCLEEPEPVDVAVSVSGSCVVVEGGEVGRFVVTIASVSGNDVTVSLLSATLTNGQSVDGALGVSHGWTAASASGDFTPVPDSGNTSAASGCTSPTTPTTPVTPPTTPVTPPTSLVTSATVLGTTITVAPSTVVVSPATLPFTGSETGSALALGMALAGLGGLVLAAVSREEEEEARARR